jgi:hypothetical protein
LNQGEVWDITFNTTGDKQGVKSQFRKKVWDGAPENLDAIAPRIDESSKNSASNIKITIQGDRDIANRIVSALKHAIKLCGGKVEPF